MKKYVQLRSTKFIHVIKWDIPAEQFESEPINPYGAGVDFRL